MLKLHLLHLWDLEAEDTDTIWILSNTHNEYLNKIQAAILECECFNLNTCQLNVQLISSNPSRELLKGIALVAAAKNQILWVKDIDNLVEDTELLNFPCLQGASEKYEQEVQLDIQESMQQIDALISTK